MNSRNYGSGVVTLALSLCLLTTGAMAQTAPMKQPAQQPPKQAKPAAPAPKQTNPMEQINQSIDQGIQKIKETFQPASDNGLTPEEEMKVSQFANGAVDKIEAAQTSIEQNKLTEAKTQLGEAQSMLENIQHTRPTGQAIEKVQTTRKQLETSQTTTTDLAPLEKEIVEFEKVTPAPKAKEHLNLAKKSLQDKKKAEAGQHLADVESHLIYAEADLPVSRTRQDVLGAQALLDQNKPKEAHKLLTDSLKHIQTLAVEVDADAKMNMPSTTPKK